MQILLKPCGARKVVEVETMAGYSAIAMARALPERRLLGAGKADHPNYLGSRSASCAAAGSSSPTTRSPSASRSRSTPPDRETPAVRAFDDCTASVEEPHRVIVPIGDGPWVGVRR